MKTTGHLTDPDNPINADCEPDRPGTSTLEERADAYMKEQVDHYIATAPKPQLDKGDTMDTAEFIGTLLGFIVILAYVLAPIALIITAIIWLANNM